MRALLVVACLLAAGCVGLPPPADAPQDPSGGRALDGCARLLVTPERPDLVAYRPLRIDLELHNCGDAPVDVTDGDACSSTRMGLTLHRGGEAYALRGSSASPGGAAKHVCGDVLAEPRPVAPGERLRESVTWNGTIIDRIEPCAMPCDLRMGARPADPGAWRLVATASTLRGLVTGEANVTLAPPSPPPLAGSIRPGERVVLFHWSLDECTVDNWGCSRAEPLPPGTYHVLGDFHPDADDWSRRPEDRVAAGWTFRIVP